MQNLKDYVSNLLNNVVENLIEIFKHIKDVQAENDDIYDNLAQAAIEKIQQKIDTMSPVMRMVLRKLFDIATNKQLMNYSQSSIGELDGILGDVDLSDLILDNADELEEFDAYLMEVFITQMDP